MGWFFRRTVGTRPRPAYRPGVEGSLLERREVPTTLPAGFTESVVASGMEFPTVMEAAPDGRLFVALQYGDIRIVKGGELSPEPFYHVDVFKSGERGLLGMTLDPNFAQNGYVYLYYTTADPGARNRILRVTADGDHAKPGSETVLLELERIDTKRFFQHIGGAMHFGPDGKLYVATGDLGLSGNAQSLKNLAGKVLRLNPDGSIPKDNPFYRRVKGLNRAIWALGLRNPFTFAFQPGTGRMYINDVGANVWEEINQGRAGANYGWPTVKGPSKDRRFVAPVYAYRHGDKAPLGSAITGGIFYPSDGGRFPTDYRGRYFFADHNNDWIQVFDPQSRKAVPFADDLSAHPVDLDVDPQGNLYYLSRGVGLTTGTIYKVEYALNQPPAFTQDPVDALGSVGHGVTFAASAGGSAPLSYQWRRDGQDVPGANGPTLTLASVGLEDEGARFDVVVTNTFGAAFSKSAVLHVTADQPPTATITAPAADFAYRVGQTVAFSGTASDREDGVLGASSMTWWVELEHNDHLHPILAPTTGIAAGSFVVPDHGGTGVLRIRIRLRVVDSAGLVVETDREIIPA